MLRMRVCFAMLLIACGGGSAADDPAVAPAQDAGTNEAPRTGVAAAGTGAVDGGGNPQMEPPAQAPRAGAASDAKPGQGSGSPSAGAQEPNRQLDRDASFEWPQTKPSDRKRCEGGKYEGTWMCDSFGLIPFDGKVSLQFVQSMDGEFLELSDARLNGLVGEGDFRFDAKLTGRVDCTTLKFTAKVSMGSYDRRDFDDTYAPVGDFSGDLTGTLDPESRQIKGEWSLLADVLVDCVGPWSASFVP